MEKHIYIIRWEGSEPAPSLFEWSQGENLTQRCLLWFLSCFSFEIFINRMEIKQIASLVELNFLLVKYPPSTFKFRDFFRRKINVDVFWWRFLNTGTKKCGNFCRYKVEGWTQNERDWNWDVYCADGLKQLVYTSPGVNLVIDHI